MSKLQQSSHAVAAVDGHTRLFFVVGNPVLQVKAPAAFNDVFQQVGLNALVVPLALSAESVIETCRALLASPTTGGILVTVPYKKTLLALADERGADAHAAGAVNALRRSAGGQIIGDLFDGVGFVAGLLAAGHELLGRRVLLLGAGGAGSAIAAALARTGLAWLGISDPATGLASALARELRPLFSRGQVIQALDTPSAACDIVINATPLGMRESDPLPMDLSSLASGTLVVDVIMEPAITPLLRRAKALGHSIHPGRPMLDYQLPAYLEFFQLPHAAKLAASALALREAAPTRP